jgi:hypothetical protein
MAADSAAVFDLSRAPFHVRRDASAFEVAEEIAACFRRIATLKDRLTRSVHAAMGVIGIAAAHPLRIAADRLARDIDAGIGDGAANAYHNRQHFCEVMLGALYLSLRAPLEPPLQAQLLVAALAHDFHHDGRSSKETPFRLERLTVRATAPYLEAAGIPADEQRRIVALILATETTIAAPIARRCYRHLALGDVAPRFDGIDAPLAAIGTDAQLALQAVLLGEADVLASAGLTIEYGDLTQERLAQEWGRPLTAADKLHFLEVGFGDFTVSRFLSPNVQRMKAEMRRRCEAVK